MMMMMMIIIIIMISQSVRRTSGIKGEWNVSNPAKMERDNQLAPYYSRERELVERERCTNIDRERERAR